MDTPDNPSPAASEDLRQTCASLRQQINILIFALFLVSATFASYLYIQDRWTNRELQGARTVVLTFEQKEYPQINAFVRQLVEYGKAHPDFDRIIDKYHMSEISTNTPSK
jgi:hypothetical protein